MPELVMGGYVYIALPPLYKISKGKTEKWVYTDEEKDRLLEEYKDVQTKIFKLLGINDEEMNAKFGFFLNALSYGCPPHGGIAFGIDRLAMILLQLDSIREIIAFPKTQSTACLMTESPSEANNQQLAELSLKTIKNK